MAERNKSQSESEFLSRWGISPENRTTSGPTSETRNMSTDDFMKRWAVAPESRKQVDKPKEDQRPYTSKLNAQIVQGMPIIGPLMDKAIAATGAAITPLFGKEANSHFTDRYSKNLEEIRSGNREFAEKNPIASTAANVVGGTLATVPLGATNIGARAMGMVGPSWGARLYQGALGGGVMGGADAALRGENPITGAEVGGVVGGASPLVGHAVEKGVSGVANYLFPRPGPLRGTNSVARNWLTNALEGETPSSILAARTRMGPSGVFADINPALTDIAGGIADIPGPGKSLIRDTYRTRQAGQRDRIDDAITKALGPRIDLADVTRSDLAARKAAADPLYEKFRTLKIHPTDELKKLVPILEQDGLFANANHLMTLEGKPAQQNFFTGGERKSWPTAEAVDYVKQAIDGRIGEALRAGNNNVARVYGGLKRRLDDAIANHPDKQIAKVWNEARESWANPTAIMQAREAGQDVWKRGVRGDELGYELTDMTPPERTAFRQGARDQLAQLMDASVRGDTSVRNMLLAPANQEKIAWLATRKGYNPQQLTDQLEQEVRNANTYQNVVGGSQTTPKKERVNALLPTPMDDSYLRQINLAQPMTLIPDALRPQTIFEGARAQRYSDAARQVAPLLMTKQGPQMNDLVTAIMDEQARRTAANATAAKIGNFITGMISGPGQSIAENRLIPQ
jgi:hypothetical protein